MRGVRRVLLVRGEDRRVRPRPRRGDRPATDRRHGNRIYSNRRLGVVNVLTGTFQCLQCQREREREREPTEMGGSGQILYPYIFILWTPRLRLSPRGIRVFFKKLADPVVF